MNYEQIAKALKALSDPNRVKIIDLLSCGSLCACDVLQHFDFTQPTLSHHIKVLSEVDLVRTDKQGTWHYYSINYDQVEILKAACEELFRETEDCICHSKAKHAVDETGQLVVVEPAREVNKN